MLFSRPCSSRRDRPRSCPANVVTLDNTMCSPSEPETETGPRETPARGLGPYLRQHGLALLLIGAGLAIAIIIRAKLYGFRSGDLRDAFLVWCKDIETKGFAEVLIHVGNYNAPYVYVLWLATKLPLQRVFVLKGLSMLCDFVAAGAMAWIVHHAFRSKARALLAGFALLVTPTVVLNGAWWGQCDMVYAAPLFLALAAMLGRRPYLASVLFGVAISVKLQAVFLVPLLAIWVLRRELPWRAVLLIPATFLLTLVPAWFAGCKTVDLLMIYPKQTHYYSALTLNAPTVFALLADEPAWLGPLGVWFAAAVALALFVACVRAKRQTTPAVLVQEAMVFSSLIPFLLPHMHERYLFLADTLSVLYCFFFPRRFWVAVFVVGASVVGYSSYVFSKTPVPLTVAAAMMGVASVVVAADLLRSHHPQVFVAPERAE
jgi:Gpi18-like mannosyltransferase